MRLTRKLLLNVLGLIMVAILLPAAALMTLQFNSAQHAFEEHALTLAGLLSEQAQGGLRWRKEDVLAKTFTPFFEDSTLKDEVKGVVLFDSNKAVFYQRWRSEAEKASPLSALQAMLATFSTSNKHAFKLSGRSALTLHPVGRGDQHHGYGGYLWRRCIACCTR